MFFLNYNKSLKNKENSIYNNLDKNKLINNTNRNVNVGVINNSNSIHKNLHKNKLINNTNTNVNVGVINNSKSIHNKLDKNKLINNTTNTNVNVSVINNNIYFISNIEGGGSYKYMNDIIKHYTNNNCVIINNKNKLINTNYLPTDIILVQQLLKTDIYKEIERYKTKEER